MYTDELFGVISNGPEDVVDGLSRRLNVVVAGQATLTRFREAVKVYISEKNNDAHLLQLLLHISSLYLSR
jgi:hypothetical protein